MTTFNNIKIDAVHENGERDALSFRVHRPCRRLLLYAPNGCGCNMISHRNQVVTVPQILRFLRNENDTTRPIFLDQSPLKLHLCANECSQGDCGSRGAASSETAMPPPHTHTTRATVAELPHFAQSLSPRCCMSDPKLKVVGPGRILPPTPAKKTALSASPKATTFSAVAPSGPPQLSASTDTIVRSGSGTNLETSSSSSLDTSDDSSEQAHNSTSLYALDSSRSLLLF